MEKDQPAQSAESIDEVLTEAVEAAAETAPEAAQPEEGDMARLLTLAARRMSIGIS